MVRNSNYKNGNSAFLFFLENNAISFVGNGDAQPNKNLYILRIDGILIQKYKGEDDLGSESIDADGTYRMEGDPLKKPTITCSAITTNTTSPKKVFEFHFKSKEVNLIHGD